jgi:hypothetical protein
MRALCGAIIAAGAMIGLGLIALGIGTRYQSTHYHDLEGNVQWVYLRHLDTALMILLVTGLGTLAIGLGIAFVGLAYHHHRRHLESLHHHAQHPRGPGDRASSERVTI